MAIHSTIEEAIDENARSGVRHTIEGSRQMTKYSLKELIEAERYMTSKTSAAKEHFGLRFTRLTPPGTG